jgi:hypothetical protein
MELAIFSDIEFVGIAADRHIVMDASRRERRDSCSGSSNISLALVGGEVERSVHTTYPPKDTISDTPWSQT